MFDWFAVAILPDSLDDFKTPMTVTFIALIVVIVIILVLMNIFVAGLIKPLQQMIKIASEASKAKSTFLATMSHEIRTPMNAIIGISQIELSKDNLTEEQAMALGKIYDSGNNLLGIINDVLDMSKIESGKLEVNPVNYDTPSLINDTVQLNMVRIGSKPIEFLLDVYEDLPSRVIGDDLRIKQILNNLLSNAIKYTAAGIVKLSVSHFSTENGDLMLRFKVSDTGQGLKPEDQKRLFSEYVRFNESANRKTEGTGIGLNITNNLIKMMGGKINVESEYGKGSTFEVILKQERVDCPPIGKEVAEKLREFKFSGKKHFANLQISRELMPYGKVLVVDDVESNLYVAKGLLAPYKLSIETTLSGFETIDLINAGKTYDIIFMDHMMTEMDGIETTQKLREQGYKGVIVALTANAIAGNEEMFMKNGFDGFVSKPIDIRQLNTVLNKFIRDKYPEEAEKYKAEEALKSTTTNIPLVNDLSAIDPKLLEIVSKDAKKAVGSLRQTKANGDIKLFTTNAHAMKSALANIGEKKMSAAALELENAGRKGDKEFIDKNAEKFIDLLLSLIERIDSLKAEDKDSDEEIIEDTANLAENLAKIKSACEDYDDTAAYAVLDLLKEKQWKKETEKALEEIRDSLFLHSDFDKAAELTDKILQGV
jgi:signal transduction histidine kinase/CheY-like chemotaxis protein